jgi:hypothetical protein
MAQQLTTITPLDVSEALRSAQRRHTDAVTAYRAGNVDQAVTAYRDRECLIDLIHDHTGQDRGQIRAAAILDSRRR